MKRKTDKWILLLAAALLLGGCGGQGDPVPDGTYVKPVEASATSESGSVWAPTPTEAGSPTASEAPSETDLATAPSGTEALESRTTEGPAGPAVISSGEAPGESTARQEETTGTKAPAGRFEASDLLFTYRGLSARVGESFDYKAFEEAWGRARVEKGQACIGGGFDENYYFGDDLTVFTLGDSGKQVIYDIYITEAGFTTAKGAQIGATTREELRQIYGEPIGSVGATDRYSAEGILVSFTFSGGVLAEIDFNNT